jgi:hypothetical protein
MMAVSANLRRLIDAAAPYWAGEAAVFRIYWDWDKRTREADRRWLAYQCSKEIWGSGLAPLDKGIFLGPAEQLIAAFPKIDTEMDRHAVLDIAERGRVRALLRLRRCVRRARAPRRGEDQPAGHQAGLEGGPRALGAALRAQAREPEARRSRDAFHRGRLLHAVLRGMALAVHGGTTRANALIAEACRKVYEDEFGHMLKGIVGLDREGLSAADWQMLERMSGEQLRGRIHMRNAQFGYPLAGAQLEAALAGKLAPLAFDYSKAQAKLAA